MLKNWIAYQDGLSFLDMCINKGNIDVLIRFHLFYSFHKKQITPIFIVSFTPLVFLPSMGRHYPFLTILPYRLPSFPEVYTE